MDRYLHLLRIRSGADVLFWTAAITLIAVAAPVVALAVPMAFMPRLSSGAYWTVLGICAAIPLLIAPPISLFGLSMLRLLTITIDRVDEHVRHDTLTGVLTRAFFLNKTREALPRGGAFLMADADHFKTINDTFGHEVGDLALRQIGETLRTALPAGTLIGRLGGEEFGVFLRGADDAAAAMAAANVCAALRVSGASVAGHPLNLTLSIGGAVHDRTQMLEQTMKRADAALYQAKRSGRDRHFITGATDTMPGLLLKTDRKSA